MILFLTIFSKNFGSVAEWNSILDGIFHNQEKMNAEISDVTFDVQYTYLETKSDGKIEKSIEVWRKVYMKDFENQQHKFLRVLVNKRQLNPVEMEKNMKEWQQYEKMIKNTKMPFDSKFRAGYNYSLLDSVEYDSNRVWKIGFEPKNQNPGMVRGFAYVLKQDTNVIQLNFVPVKLPKVLHNFQIQIDYSQQNGFWLPSKFFLKMDVVVKIIAILYKRHIAIQEEYYNYQFNQRIDNFLNKN